MENEKLSDLIFNYIVSDFDNIDLILQKATSREILVTNVNIAANKIIENKQYSDIDKLIAGFIIMNIYRKFLDKEKKNASGNKIYHA